MEIDETNTPECVIPLSKQKISNYGSFKLGILAQKSLFSAEMSTFLTLGVIRYFYGLEQKLEPQGIARRKRFQIYYFPSRYDSLNSKNRKFCIIKI